MKKVFKNANGELRSGWKIGGVIILDTILELVLMIIFGVVAGIYIVSRGSGVSQIELESIVNDFINNNIYGMLTTQGISFISLVILILIFLRKVDKKGFASIGVVSIRKEYKNFTLGLLLGIISISVIFFILLGTKNISVTNISEPYFSAYTFSGLILFAIVGVKEELLCRGYCIAALNQMGKPWVSVIISSIIFSALHLFNPNVKALGLINVFFVGVLFGYMYIKTKSLWMPIGYHITWNYFQGCIYGFHVSGLNIQGIFNTRILKDNILTGGAFGPEAGILTTIVIIIGLLSVWKLPVSNKSEEVILERITD